MASIKSLPITLRATVSTTDDGESHNSSISERQSNIAQVHEYAAYEVHESTLGAHELHKIYATTLNSTRRYLCKHGYCGLRQWFRILICCLVVRQHFISATLRMIGTNMNGNRDQGDAKENLDYERPLH